MDERSFGKRTFIGASSATLVACACAGGIAGCFKANTAARPVSGTRDSAGRIPLGPAADLAVGQELKVTVPGVNDAVLVARVSDTEIHAVSISCTHFGSEVGLALARKRFVCPSHGSQFAYDGSVLEGPASDPLARYHVEDDDGQLFLVASSSAT